MSRIVSLAMGCLVVAVFLSLSPAVSAEPASPWPVPENCLFFMDWSPQELQANPDSKNSVERILAEPEVREFVAKLEKSVRQAGDQPHSQMVLVPFLLDLLKVRLRVYWEDSQQPITPQSVRAVIISASGPQSGQVAGRLRQLFEDQGETCQNVEINGETFYQVQPPSFPQVTWGPHGNELWIALGEGVLAQSLKQAGGKLPEWYQAAVKKAAVPRPFAFFYLAPQTLMQRIPAERLQRAAETTGWTNVKEIIGTMGLDEAGGVARTRLELDGDPQGFLAAVTQPLQLDDLAPIPADATIAVAARFSPNQVFSTFVEGVRQLNEEIAPEKEINAMAELDFPNQIVRSLGDRWCLYSSPSDLGIFPMVTIVGTTSEPARLRAAIETSVRQSQPITRLIMRQREFAGRTLFGLQVALPVYRPTWCVTDREVIFGMSPQQVKSYLVRPRDFPSLATLPAIHEEFKKGGDIVKLVYLDMPATFDELYRWTYLFFTLQELHEESRRSGNKPQPALGMSFLDWPSPGAIRPHLKPSILVVRRTATGFEVSERYSFPGGSLCYLAPLTAAGTLPAILQSRIAAKRIQSMNNLKQIGLALHNHHDVYASFPPAHRPVDGKPGLSWRVHILPFLEQMNLYKQFRFDEPWDSPHNLALVEKMPPVYRSPLCEVPPGHTTYLGVAGPHGVFRPGSPMVRGTHLPADGVRLAEIQDGSSNTAMVVEVGPKQAVIWTKPDDFVPDETKPLLGLTFPLKDGTNVLFCDGSVLFVSSTIDIKSLRAIFTRDGAEQVDLP